MSYRRLGLLSLLGIALITLLVAALLIAGFSSDAHASAPAASDGSAWTYQQMSTGQSGANPYLGSPLQQWLMAAAITALASSALLLRRRLRG